MENATSLVVVSAEVRAALAAGRPVVALETTVLAHGLPRPRNREAADAMEAAVRSGGAVPAHVAVLDGRLRIGLDARALDRLSEGQDVAKCSTRDLAARLASGLPGATTAAATLFAAGLAGIRFMATGGIGGVHRGGETSLDWSADLHELQRARLALVCSGAKIILDLPRTLEVLETMGVTVAGCGTDEFPGFYTARTGLAVPRLDGPVALARLVRHQAMLGWPSAVLLANPPPAAALAPDELEPLIEEALAQARADGIAGPAETPYLLRRIAQASGGRSVAVNQALLTANARLAAEVAAAFSALDTQRNQL
ncbi:pseudouridine-5'-phosphate glycosidase [Geminicoccaceae bacterium 1502E]|nr:pseudouridine-5'-phosphate glycosidase [Geminicoccaceae bacterium 1502E]